MSRSNSTQKQKDRHIREIHKHHHGKIALENRLADVHDVDPIVRQHIAHLLMMPTLSFPITVTIAFMVAPFDLAGSSPSRTRPYCPHSLLTLVPFQS